MNKNQNQIQNPIEIQKKEIFLYMLYATGFFMLLEISFFILTSKNYAGDFYFFFKTFPVVGKILPGIIYFISAEIFLHLLFCLVLYWITLNSARLLQFSDHQAYRLGVMIWVWGITIVMTANQYFFPNSKFSYLTETMLFSPLITNVVVFLLGAIGGVLFILMSMQLVMNIQKNIVHPLRRALWALLRVNSLRIIILSCIFFLSLFFFFFSHTQPLAQYDAATVDQPNIILVGVDSLRPDFLHYFGRSINTPFFDAFLKQATVFSDAYTPLARTFPFWTSMLSGLYPREVGIRTDLQQVTHAPKTLASILQQQGYTTWYATDETRFSNIDKKYGFDQLITPPVGLNDFIIGTFNDFPLSNLLINTVLGRWLFPYNYANRPAFITYQPNSFLHLLQLHLQAKRSQPLFLAVHFCLTHTPFLYADLSTGHLTPSQAYEAAIERADTQIADFFQLLKRYQVLQHAIVVLFSDHGEALALPGDRITEASLFLPRRLHQQAIPHFYPLSLDEEAVNQSVGHGTDVLGLSQYHIVLAFKLIGLGGERHTVIPSLVSGLDIKPTILSLIHVTDFPSSGQSLLPFIVNAGNKQPLSFNSHQRLLFLESDFSPRSIRAVYPNIHQVLLDGLAVFRVDPLTFRLVIKTNMLSKVIKSKQYAVMDREWILALYPQGQNQYMPILVNRATREWTNDLQSDFAQKASVSHLLLALKQFYENEIGTVTAGG